MTKLKPFLLVALLFCINANAIEQDKLLHAGGSYAVAITTSFLVEDSDHPVLYSFAAGMVPGLVKYAHDRQVSGFYAREKNQDMIANVIGAASGAWIGHGLFVYASKKQAGIGVTVGF